MRTVRSHVELTLTPGSRIELPADSRAHLTRVLRLRDGDPVTLFNGDGYDYPARLVIAGRDCAAEVLDRHPAAAAEAGLAITLVQVLARGEKMDWIVQKATELGVAAIVPVTSQRCEVRLDRERADKRGLHWRQVAISACEQCGRSRIPTIAPAQPLHAALPSIDASLRLLLDPGADTHLRDLVPGGNDSIALAIGPEGGFEAHEVHLLESAGWQRLRLHGRILRTETAGLATIAALLALHGEL